MQKTTFLSDSKTVLKVQVCVNINCTFLFAVRTRLLQVAEWAAFKHSGSNKDVNLPRVNGDVTRSNPDDSVIHIPGEYACLNEPDRFQMNVSTDHLKWQSMPNKYAETDVTP